MLAKVKDAAGRKILFLPHALRQMLRPALLITAREVHQVVERGSIIEEYPDDPRGPSCLMLGYGLDNRRNRRNRDAHKYINNYFPKRKYPHYTLQNLPPVLT